MSAKGTFRSASRLMSACGLGRQMLAPECDDLTREQGAPMICRASSSMVANVDRRPGANDDVLVAVLARAHAEVNRPSASSWMVPAFWATAEVVPHRGTVRVGNEHDALGGVRDAEQRLGVVRVALLVQPREAVVAGRDEVEADLLGPDGVGDGLLSMRLAKLG
jgi:hypothetical protein